MKRRKTLIIFAAAAAVLIGIIIAEILINRHIDSINSIDEIILTQTEDKLDSLEIEKEEGSIKFVKDGEGWKLDGDADFPLDPEIMSEFVGNFSEVHASFAIDDVEDYGQYGLNEPVCTMRFACGDTVTTYTMGDFSTIDEKRYVCVNGATVYLVDEDPFELASIDRDDYMDADTVPMLYLVKNFTMSGDANMNIVYDDEKAHVYTNAYPYYEKQGDIYRELDTDKAKAFMNKVTAAELTEYVSYTAGKDDLTQYGLADPCITIEVSGLDLNENEYSYKLYLGGVISGTKSFDVGESENTYDAYIRVGDSEKIYRFDGEAYADLIYTVYGDLRPDRVISLNIEELKSMAFSLDGTRYQVTTGLKPIDPEFSNPAAYSEDELETGYFIGEDLVSFDDVISALDALMIVEYDESAAAGKEELALTITQENEICREIKLVIYQEDSTHCTVSFNGQMLGHIERSQMADLKEGLTAAVLSRGEFAIHETEPDAD